MIDETFPVSLQAHIERFDHVAMGVHSVADSRFVAEAMGGTWKGGGIERTAGFKFAKWDLPGQGQLEMIEPIDPTDSENFLNRFLDQRGEGFHHVTFKVTDLDDAVAAASASGLVLASMNADNDLWQEAFFHPKSTHGIVIQFAQWDDEVGDGSDMDISFDEYLALR
jgi:catechol 2,3-dioxygenase-like lactoylglutathione lyase family enzyme